jgi:hypothetical protein
MPRVGRGDGCFSCDRGGFATDGAPLVVPGSSAAAPIRWVGSASEAAPAIAPW